MSVIQRSNYISASNCDAMVAAIPSLANCTGKEYRPADDKSKISVYQLLRYYSYPQSLKTIWKANIPSELSSSYLVSTFLKIPANNGILHPTTPSDPARYDLNQPIRAVGCFLSIALTDGQHLILNGTKYNVNKGDALLFDGTYTYETEISSADALWNVNMVPTWKMSTYGA